MDNSSYADISISEFLEELASSSPEPGGGSVAALAGALAAALVSMVANLTVGRESYAAVEDRVSSIRDKADELRATLKELITLDAKAYGAVVLAMQLPKDTEEEKREREHLVQATLTDAARVPLQVADVALNVARLAQPLLEIGNSNALSDAAMAAIMAEAAAQSAALNVKINLVHIEDEEFKTRTWMHAKYVLIETAEIRHEVISAAYQKL